MLKQMLKMRLGRGAFWNVRINEDYLFRHMTWTLHHKNASHINMLSLEKNSDEKACVKDALGSHVLQNRT